MPSVNDLHVRLRVIIKPKGAPWKWRLLASLAWILGFEIDIDQ